MSDIRRALVFATMEKYLVIATGLAMVPIVARLMSPEEFGVSILGLAVLGIAEALRDCGSGAYIVQQHELTTEKVQTAFTVTLALTLIIALVMVLSAKTVAAFYRVEGLESYLYVTAACFLLGPLVHPVQALLRRDLAFDTIAGVTALSSTVNAASTIIFAYLGYSYMSFAWANLASGLTGMLFGLYFKPVFRIFRLSLLHWRQLVNFGRFDSAAQILSTVAESLPYLVSGRILDPHAVGLYQRASALANLPQRALLGGLSSMIMSTLSMKVRAGEDLKANFLKTVSFVTVVHWPSLAVMALLAHPITAILLGGRWAEVVPLVQIISLALMLSFAATLVYPTLVAAGAPRDGMLQSFITVSVNVLIVYVAAHYGLQAVALSMFFTVPFGTVISTYFLRRHVFFTWTELGSALRGSFIVTAAAAAGPMIVIALNGFDTHLSIAEGLLAGMIAGMGWTLGLWLARHALFGEIVKAAKLARRLMFARFGAKPETGPL